MNDISKKAIADVVNKLVEKEITQEDYSVSLQSGFSMDSIILVEVIIELETEFDFEFKDEDLIIENFESIDAIYNNLLKYKS